MSLVIQKFEPGGKTTQPRLYKRGNDDIDLDAYIRDAESEFSYWLANSRLKDKEKQQVLDAYSQMLQGINDGTFTYRVGGGYNNSIGMSNKEKGFDAAGLAAGFLGDVLRRQGVYQAPEEKSDPSKIEWKGNSSVGAALVRRIYGSDTENLKDFVDLDPYDEKLKKRGNTNRSARVKAGLEYISKNFDNLFTSYTKADRTSALEGITAALSAFDNGTVEDNEYLDLGRATGMSNLRDMFFSGQTYGTASPAATAGAAAPLQYSNEDEWRAATHPRSTVTNFTTRKLTGKTAYAREGRLKLNSILMGMSKDNLLKLVQTGLKFSPQGYELNKGRSILLGFGQLTSFENNFIIKLALEVLRRKNYLHQSPTDLNSYYIPFVSDKLDQRGTGFVYTISPDGNHVLREMDRWDIPFFTNQWHDEFMGLVPSNKKGGILFAKNGVGNVKYNPSNYSWDDIIYNSSQFADVLKGLTLQNYESANALQNRFFTDKINDQWSSSSLGKRDEVSKYQTDFNTAYGVNLNQGAIEDAIKAGKIVRKGTTGDNLKGNYADGYSGAMTNLRHLGTSDHVKYLEDMNKILSANGLEAYLNEETNMINYRPLEQKETTVETPDEETPEQKPEEHTDAWKRVFEGGSFVNERFPSLPSVTPKGGGFYDLLQSLSPDLIGAGRLWASLHTNNRVYNTVLPSLKPVLKNTYERYSPVTGAFSLMQLKNRLGAETLSASAKPFTSDASLAAARMFEGQRQANQLLTEGFLADDQEIKRTQAEALARQEDNMARRSEVGNFNMASVNQTNRERAQLEATRLRSNWQSWDNFLQGIESRIRTRADEDRERANNFYDKLQAEQSERLYNEYMERANADLLAWTKEPGNEHKDITEWAQYPLYKRMREEARSRANSMIYQDMARRYGWAYNNPYTDESNNLFFARGWNGRHIS